MEISLIVLQEVAKLFLIMLMGYVLVRRGVLKASDGGSISAILVYLVIPCMIINAFQIEYTPQVQNGLIYAVILAAAAHGFFILLTAVFSRLLHMDVVDQISVIYTNAAILVIPIVNVLLGSSYVVYSCGFVMVQLILLWTHGRHRLCSGERISLRGVLLNINILAIIAGIIMLLFRITLPSLIGDTVSVTADLLGPLGMLLAGMLIADVPFGDVFLKPRNYISVVLRLLVYPAALLCLFAALHADTWIADGRNVLLTVYLACVTPSCATVTSMAQLYHADAERASLLYVLTTSWSIVTMPMLIGLFAVLIG